mgnify:CR=1 FL=1
MPIFEINLPKSISKALGIPQKSPERAQQRVLKKLLRLARYTAFGQKNNFEQILLSKHPGKAFQQNVPSYNYNKIYKEWWYQTLDGKEDICWPGKIKYFALSSGTSESASKYIPITIMRFPRFICTLNTSPMMPSITASLFSGESPFHFSTGSIDNIIKGTI